MADLTADERAEVMAVLEEARFRETFPRVAEYLDVAPGLPGTGDPERDAEFDLRLVYSLTQSCVNGNPYWELVQPLVSVRDDRRVIDGGTKGGSARLAFAQMLMQDIYAYAIPSSETIDWVRQFCDGSPIIEVGAGRGYWAHQLAAAGLAVDALDLAQPHSNDSFSNLVKRNEWYQIRGIEEFESRVSDNRDCVLFLCWPPGWQDPMASDTLRKFRTLGGRRLVYFGEGQGGRTANDEFWAALSEGWKMESQDRDFVSWWNLSDRASAWTAA